MAMDQDFCCVDWGTSSFRLWHLSAAEKILNEKSSDQGMSRLSREEFEPVLERHLSDLGIAATTPVVVCGMAGAAQGWKNAPYLDVPTRLDGLFRGAIKVGTGNREVRILPGLAQIPPLSPDVIRGEETLLLGAKLNGLDNGLLCLPGTHSKWVKVEQGAVTSFSTVMTGEVFELVSKHSTLSHFLGGASAGLEEQAAFCDAVAEAMEKPEAILSALFSIRAIPLLLGESEVSGMPARLSGLLIGSEVASMRSIVSDKVHLVSDGPLAAAYEKALGLAGLKIEKVNAREMVLAGLISAANALWGKN